MQRGLTMHPEHVEAFSDRFEEVVSATINPEHLVQQVTIDAELRLEQIDPKFFRILGQFAPFGPENMSPVFLTKNVYVSGVAGLVGESHFADGGYTAWLAGFWLYRLQYGRICYPNKTRRAV